MEHPNFGYLCNKIALNTPDYNVYDNIEFLKILASFQPVPNDTINALLQGIRDKIITLSIDDLIFLDFILRKFEPNTYEFDENFQVLKFTIPMLFQFHLSKCENFTTSHLRFITDNIDSVSNETINNIVTALHGRGTKFSANDARQIILSYCTTGPITSNCESLIENAFKVLSNTRKAEYADVKRMFKYIGQAFRKHPVLYNEKFFESSIAGVIKSGMELSKLLSLQDILNQMVSV